MCFSALRKVIKQDGDFGRSYYILFDKNKNDVTDYDLVINVTDWYNYNKINGTDY